MNASRGRRPVRSHTSAATIRRRCSIMAHGVLGFVRCIFLLELLVVAEAMVQVRKALLPLALQRLMERAMRVGKHLARRHPASRAIIGGDEKRRIAVVVSARHDFDAVETRWTQLRA